MWRNWHLLLSLPPSSSHTHQQIHLTHYHYKMAFGELSAILPTVHDQPWPPILWWRGRLMAGQGWDQNKWLIYQAMPPTISRKGCYGYGSLAAGICFFSLRFDKIKLGAFEMDTFVCVDHLGESPSLSRGWGVTKPAWLEIEKGLTAVYRNECLTQSKSHVQAFQALLLRRDLKRCQTIMIKLYCVALYSWLHYFHDYCV